MRYLPAHLVSAGRHDGRAPPGFAPIALLLLVVAGASVLRLAGMPVRGRTG